MVAVNLRNAAVVGILVILAFLGGTYYSGINTASVAASPKVGIVSDGPPDDSSTVSVPPPTSAPQAASTYEVQVAYRLKVRKERSGDSEIIARFEEGSLIMVRYEPDFPGWVTVSLPAPALPGYALAKQIDYPSLAKKQGVDVKGYLPDDPMDPAKRVSATSSPDVGNYVEIENPDVQSSPSTVNPPPRRVLSNSGVYADVGGGHWIKSNSDDGSILTLEDGSIWQVESYDTVTSSLWLAPSDIVVIESSSALHGYKLVNSDDRETVEAQFLGMGN